jgi:hypothetical protein
MRRVLIPQLFLLVLLSTGCNSSGPELTPLKPITNDDLINELVLVMDDVVDGRRVIEAANCERPLYEHTDGYLYFSFNDKPYVLLAFPSTVKNVEYLASSCSKTTSISFTKIECTTLLKNGPGSNNFSIKYNEEAILECPE